MCCVFVTNLTLPFTGMKKLMLFGKSVEFLSSPFPMSKK